jgi:hypothetical protein
LIQFVRATRQQLAAQNVQFAQVGGRNALVLVNTATGIAAANIVGAGAGNLVGAGAGNLVGAGAGNLVGAGAGNIVGAGAGNLVGAGAGNIVGAGAGNVVQPGYSVQAADGARFTFRLPNGGQLRVRAN